MRNPVVLLLAATLSLPTPAIADAPPGDGDPAVRAAAARDGGDEGLRHFAGGRWLEAYGAFKRADALYHAPTLLLYMAHCQKRLGKLVTARGLYQKVVDERIPRTAPLQFLTAQAVAREELDHLERQVPFIELTLAGGSLPAARVTVDGDAVAAVASQRFPLDPGDHVIKVRVGAGEPIQRVISLKEGTTLKLALSLPELPPSSPPTQAAVVAPRTADVAPTPPIARGPIAPALAAFGVGAAALGVGAVTGAVSLGEVAELRAQCGPARTCPASAQPTASSAGRLADASTIAFIAGVAALATGVVLLVLRPGGTPEDGAPGLRVGLGPSSASIAGAF